MARLSASVRIENDRDDQFAIDCRALVDTGAAHLVLPAAWRERLGSPRVLRRVRAELATQEVVDADICGPVLVLVEGFDWIGTEVMFLEMRPQDGDYEPLLGHLVLEHCGAAVDMENHRLVPVRAIDLK